MPLLTLATNISPILGVLMSIALLGMIYNTAVGMLYAFTVRIVPAESKHFKWVVWAIGVGGFVLSFVGFITLVSTVYPAMGYLGFVLMIAIVIAWFVNVKRSKAKSLVVKEA